MSRRTEPPFRADHVGSLLRPARLMQAREQRAAGQITEAALREVEDDAILDVVAMQRDAGLQSATDGEFRRAAWHMDFIYRLGGVTQADEKLHVQFFNDGGTLDFAPAALRINERVRLGETIFADHFRFLKDNVRRRRHAEAHDSRRRAWCITEAAARRSTSRCTRTWTGFWDDLTAAYAEEVRRLGDLGCTYLQLDDTSLAYLNDPRQRELIASLGGDREHQHELYIRNINRVLAAKPTGHADHDAHVPRQLSLLVGGGGRLRLRRRSALRWARRRWVLPRVRRRALGGFEPLRLRARTTSTWCSGW